MRRLARCSGERAISISDTQARIVGLVPQSLSLASLSDAEGWDDARRRARPSPQPPMAAIVVSASVERQIADEITLAERNAVVAQNGVHVRTVKVEVR